MRDIIAVDDYIKRILYIYIYILFYSFPLPFIKKKNPYIIFREAQLEALSSWGGRQVLFHFRGLIKGSPSGEVDTIPVNTDWVHAYYCRCTSFFRCASHTNPIFFLSPPVTTHWLISSDDTSEDGVRYDARVSHRSTREWKNFCEYGSQGTIRFLLRNSH